MSPSNNARRSATLRAASRHDSGLHHQRRQSATERIDQILENARERADSIAAESMSSNSTPASPGPGGLRRSRTSLSFDDARPDETTAFLSRRLSGQNYQSLNDSDGAAAARKSVYKRSQSTLRDGPSEEIHENEDADLDDETSRTRQLSTWAKVTGPFRSIELENKGSVARDHLALERTFLAWLRTSLAFTSIGIAVTQLFRLNTSLPDSGSLIDHDTLRQVGKPLGAAFLVISILILLLGYRRFSVGQEWIIKGKFPASRGTVILLVLVTLAIMVLSLVVVVVIHPPDDRIQEDS